jgi:hypothetical protein
MVTEAINTAITAGACPECILVRADSAYCTGKTVAAVVKAGAMFSFTIARNPAVDAAIATIGDQAYEPVRYPGAVVDPDTGERISDAQVAEVARLVRPDRRPLGAPALRVVRRQHRLDHPGAICHNLLRAAGTLTATARYAAAGGATLRAHLVNLPARLARPQRRPVLHLPAHWPRAQPWLRLWRAVFIT